MSEWSESEERAFSAIMEAGDLDRLEAIRLLRRYRGDVDKATKRARELLREKGHLGRPNREA